jgi:hypothetical protein
MCFCSNNIYYGWAPDESDNEIDNESNYGDLICRKIMMIKMRVIYKYKFVITRAIMQ